MGGREAEVLRNEKGTTAVEYAMLAAFIAVALIVVVTDVGGGVGDLLDRVEGYFPQSSD